MSSGADEYPRILSRNRRVLSPWVAVVEKEVQFAASEQAHVYHSVELADYIVVLATLPDGRMPVVSQYRPAVEEFTCEFPAGLLEPGESPEEACRRELLEEAGLRAVRVRKLGSLYADTGRLSNRVHAFAVEAEEATSEGRPEQGISVELLTMAELRERIRAGQFHLQLHVAALTLWQIMGSDGHDGEPAPR